jgi:hypothetical protein
MLGSAQKSNNQRAFFSLFVGQRDYIHKLTIVFEGCHCPPIYYSVCVLGAKSLTQPFRIGGQLKGFVYRLFVDSEFVEIVLSLITYRAGSRCSQHDL